MSNIEIRSPRPEDARGILEVYYRSWLKAYPSEKYGISVEDIEDSYKDSFTEEKIKMTEERIKNPKENMRSFVAVDGDTIIGVSRVVIRESYNQLQTIYLLPEYQGKGIGTMLWNAAKTVMDPKKDIIVQVAVYNEQAIGFYKKLGFIDTGKRFSEERFRMKSGNVIPEMELIIKRT